MDNIEWIFSGLGTYILGLFISFLFGGVSGYFIGLHCKIVQKQRAGDNSNLRQVGLVIKHEHK